MASFCLKTRPCINAPSVGGSTGQAMRRPTYRAPPNPQHPLTRLVLFFARQPAMLHWPEAEPVDGKGRCVTSVEGQSHRPHQPPLAFGGFPSDQ